MKVLDKVLKVGGKIAGAVALASIYGPAARADVGDTELEEGGIRGIPIYKDDLSNLLETAVAIILWAAGAIAFAFLIYGGILYITAGGDAEKAGKGRTAIVNAIIGIVIIAAALAIYNFVIGRLK